MLNRVAKCDSCAAPKGGGRGGAGIMPVFLRLSHNSPDHHHATPSLLVSFRAQSKNDTEKVTRGAEMTLLGNFYVKLYMVAILNLHYNNISLQVGYLVMKRFYDISSYSHTVIAAAIVLLSAVATSCRRLPSYLSGEQAVARVGKAELTAAEVGSAVPSSLSGEDSTAYAELYVDRWVRRMLKVHEGEELFSESVADIDRQVEEFRQSLIVRRVDQYYVERSTTDTLVTDDEVRAYYDSHRSDFKLDRTIVRGRMVRFPESYRRQMQLLSLMSSPSKEKQRDFEEICTKNDFYLSDNRETWVDLSDFMSELPVTGSYGAVLLRNTGKVQNLRDAESIYYVEITEVLRSGDLSPLERAEPTIRRILYNARRNDIIRAHEEELIQSAAERREITINGERIMPKQVTEPQAPKPNHEQKPNQEQKSDLEQKPKQQEQNE